MVQRKVFIPTDKPEMELDGELALAKVPVPEMTVQKPDPITGVLAASVAVVAQML